MRVGILSPPRRSEGQRMLEACLLQAGHSVAEPVYSQDMDVTVCWGTSSTFGLNSKPAVTGCEQLAALADAALGAPYKLPEFTADPTVAAEWVRGGGLVFGRQNNHTQGRDIVGPTQRAFYDRDYWVKMIPAIAEEWRIHSFAGKSIARGKKIYEGEDVQPPIVRSRRRGWRMAHDITPPNGLRPAAKAAVAALGYDFGAVDLVRTADGSVYVLEVNKQPGLDGYTAAQYVSAIERYVRD